MEATVTALQNNDETNSKKRKRTVTAAQGNDERNSKKRKRDENDFAIDEDDYRVLEQLLKTTNGHARITKGIVRVDKESRVWKFRVPLEVMSLPPSIGRWNKLIHLEMFHQTLLAYKKNLLSDLPEEIGNLSCLEKLGLHGSNITCIPSSIGQLQNLKELYLPWTDKLSNLPEEIGNLSNLQKLELCHSNIKSLPSSIGRLQNLRELDLSGTKKLSYLPEEIGNLASLEKLYLGWHSNIKSLPSSIGQLQNLKCLNLFHAHKLSNLPEEIANLASLETLNLLGSKCEYLSFSMFNKLGYSLLLRTGRFRKSKGFIQSKPNLWPILLNNASCAFCISNDDKYLLGGSLRQFRDFQIPKPDAIYKLLLECRETFISILIGASSRGTTATCSSEVRTFNSTFAKTFLDKSIHLKCHKPS